MSIVVDVLVQQRTARVGRPLTYLVPAGVELEVGDVVRVPLGPRELYGYVLTPAREDGARTGGLRPIAARAGVPRAFDAAGLALARWIAERYCCTLGEALGAVVLAAGVPRVVDRFAATAALVPERFPSVPERLVRLIREDFGEGFSLDALLRHPEARRAGDRRSLLRSVSALVRAGALERSRTFLGPRTGEAHEKVLEATGSDVRGPRVAALLARVREAGVLRRRDALLEGFSQAVIARALREGALRESERRPTLRAGHGPPVDQDFVPTAEQGRAIEAIVRHVEDARFGELLLQGVTGSGKTFVYIRAIARMLELGARAIVLVPEIALTPQTARRFEGAFGERVAVLHSGLSERERYASWQAAARGEVDVVVGARSAVFAPLPDCRLVVVDEAHERTYKQDVVPRYDALAVARERMRAAGGTLVLGSATPPLEAYAAALRGAIEHLRLERRASAMPLPATHVVDLAGEFAQGNRRIFSTRLVEALDACLARREKAVLFVNRRGSASFMLCRACGAVPRCERCTMSLVVHRAERLLRCHLCDAQRAIPERCPQCGGGPIREFGVGTQKVAETAQSLFPAARIVRMDSDTTTRIGDHARLLDAFAAQGDILVGTQMVAKGLDFPEVTLVGVVAADIGLHLPDFRAAERTFDLLTQVAGRSGRARAGEAIVQTYNPEHPAIRFAARHDFDGFAAHELEERRESGFPPFAELVYLGVIGRRREAVVAAAARYARSLRSLEGCEVLGPAPYPIARLNDEWRYRLAVKAAESTHVRAHIRATLLPAAAAERATRLAVNVDP
ncbi:MAG: primosomal protein N' [Candidatus Baltobacteraceae bacterium]